MKLRLRYWVLFSYVLVFSLTAFLSVLVGTGKPSLPPDVRTGILPNGIPYFLQKNLKPANRVELRLVVRVGSSLEEEHERGIAHLLEHMQFYGTQNFKNKEIVDFLESIGMNFGPDINAFTSFNETQYILQVPTNNLEHLKKACVILNDWAHGPVIDPLLLEREKKVVEEERRRQYENVSGRVTDFIIPKLYDNTVYAHRLPIGTQKVIAGAMPELVLGFSSKWYTPENMAVVAVGDMDPHEIESLLMEAFIQPFSQKGMSAPANASVPLLTGKQTYSFRDKELPSNEILLSKFKEISNDYNKNWREEILKNFAFGIVNQDLRNLSLQANPPFISAYIGSLFSSPSGDVDQLELLVSPYAGKVLAGWEAAFSEVRRTILHGFAQEDFHRTRAELLSQVENSYAQRGSIEHHTRAGALANYYLNGGLVLDDTAYYEQEKALIHSITPEELHRWFSDQFSLDHFKLFCLSIDKSDNPEPSKDDLLASIDRIAKEILPPKTVVTLKPLFQKEPEPGEIVLTSSIPEIGVTIWELSNGAKVYLKPNTFDRNEVIVEAASSGGLSLVQDKDYLDGSFVSRIFSRTGLGELNFQELTAFLSGKQAGVSFHIADYDVSLSGSSTRTDLLTLFQLLHQHFGPVYRDAEAESALRKSLVEEVKNTENLPETIFHNEIMKLMYNTDACPRHRPTTSEQITKLNFDNMARIYRQFFTSASNFYFVITGDFDEEELKTLVCTYLASLPKGPKSSFKDLGVRSVPGPVRQDVKKGVDHKASIFHMIEAEKTGSPRVKQIAKILEEVLSIRLFEAVREALGGTYGVNVGVRAASRPYSHIQLHINFTCDPARQEEMIQAVKNELRAIRQGKISDSVFSKAVEILVKQIEEAENTNSYWNRMISHYLDQNDQQELKNIPRHIEALKKLTLADVQALAQEVLLTEKMLTVTWNKE